MIVQESNLTPMSVQPYRDNLENLLSHLSLLDLRLLSEIQRLRLRSDAQEADEFKGMFVSEDDIERLLSEMAQTRNGTEGKNFQPLANIIAQKQNEIAERTSASEEAGVTLSIENLRRTFGLCDFELSVVALCIAPEIDIKYETLYSYLQEDVSKRKPTLNLVLSLLCFGVSERVEYRNLLVNSSPLIQHGLMHFSDDTGARGTSLLGSVLTLEQRVVDFILGATSLDSELKSATLLDCLDITWDSIVLPTEVMERLITASDILLASLAGGSGAVLQLIGTAGSGKKSIAQAIGNSHQRKLLVVDASSFVGAEANPQKQMETAFREALLQDAILCIDGFHILLQEEPKQYPEALRTLFDYLSKRRDLTILTGLSHWRIEGSIRDSAFLTVNVPAPEFGERKRLWAAHLNGQGNDMPDEQIEDLAGKFRLRGGQIQQVVATARDMARFRNDLDTQVTVAELSAASRWHSNQKLTTMARKIESNYSWDDIVLPPDQKQQLSEICNYFANMARVYEDWGFQSKTSLGKGLNIMFAGSSGTGKTMSADIMSGELGLDLYKIDISTIISKYIGETEKNLDKIFTEAQDSNSILFFDEADALFGKRSDVKDSHDRYANIEVSYLLQKMEEYQGIVILASNFRTNMDDAFVRRMHFVVEFPVPEEEDRLEIWRRVFPAQAPMEDSVDLNFIARQFKLSGGNIKNIAVTSAFLAAQENKNISMRHLILATRREYQKMGKLLIEAEFGEYFNLIKAASRR